ncbi:hypothetical protein B9Z19DRAFT_1071562 [Tuber borchii]|uniref:Uncharacterized protein n=1 Tax=Tuber borchii TaxID=42251 RepID=A0A2T7A857_TUBBO|nr:hypothetical protein B9Z19DRAFT_1071562 [Tuber borchii]
MQAGHPRAGPQRITVMKKKMSDLPPSLLPTPEEKIQYHHPRHPCERKFSLFSSALHSISHSVHSFTHSSPVRLPKKGGDRRESKPEPTNKYLCTPDIRAFARPFIHPFIHLFKCSLTYSPRFLHHTFVPLRSFIHGKYDISTVQREQKSRVEELQ